MRPMKIILGLTALASLSACGLPGDLERPEPIFRNDPEPVAAPPQPPVVEEKVIEEEIPDDELLGGPEG